ncbi:MAG TPA: hypothetical protein PKY30_14620 [Myxococcota bacterium]|nr:hypothetical protein [Myxococcota bacterium]HNH48272.1 hypothetical protein [Myxococcota bacterium]
MNRSLYLLGVLGLVVGCDGGTEKDSGGDSGVVSECSITVDKTIPSKDQSDFYHRGVLEFHLSDKDASAKVTADFSGTTTTSEDGTIVYYTPDAPLDPSTSYSATFTYCDGDKTFDLPFSTSALGTDLTVDLVGKAYQLDLAKANIVKPPNIGSVLGSLLTTPILIGVAEVSGTQLTMVGAIGVEGGGGQDYCTQTIDFPVADFAESPYVKVGPQDTTLSISGANIKIGNLEITGTFAADGSYFGGGTLEGSVDARDIAAALPDLGYDADGLCELIAGFGAACETCPTDSAPYCLTLVANSIIAEGISGSVVEVPASDCPGCETGEPTCPV